MQRDPNQTPTAIVLGSAELASAIAVRLHDAGLRVVACDAIDPLGIRRGISFTDAWYLGRAQPRDPRRRFAACHGAVTVPPDNALAHSNRGP